MEAHEVDRNDVIAAILAAGILEPLSIEIEGPALAVEVREQWAIFPIPMISSDASGTAFGLLFVDANAFGLNDQLLLGGHYHPNNWSATAGYIRSSRGGRSPGFVGLFSFGREERHDLNQNSEVLRRFELDEISVRAMLRFPLLADTDLLTASVLFSFDDFRLRNRGEALRAPDYSLRLYGTGADFTAERNSWDGFFLSRREISVQGLFLTDFSGVSFASANVQGTWERSIVPGFRLNLRSGILFMPNTPIFFEQDPEVAQVDILPADFSARSYAGLSAGLEQRILRIPAGTVSVAASYQAVYSEGSVLGNSFDHGVTGAIFFYLNRIAIPAVGLGLAYNVQRNYLRAFLSVGLRL